MGFDIAHEPYHGPVPAGAELVLQDVRTLHGSQFRDADLILASSPCQTYSYMAMPWTRAKQLADASAGALCQHSHRTSARRAASARIAQIPRPLSDWIAQCYWPPEAE